MGYHLPWFFYQGSAIGVIFLSHRIFNFGLALWGSPAARIVAAICVTAKLALLDKKAAQHAAGVLKNLQSQMPDAAWDAGEE